MWKIDGLNATQIAKAMNCGSKIDPEINIVQKVDTINGKMILHVESKLTEDILHQKLVKYMMHCCRTIHPLKLKPLEEDEK